MADRGRIEDAIYAWRDGASYDAIHPLDAFGEETALILHAPGAVKDLARVISHMLDGETPPRPTGTVRGEVVRDFGELPAAPGQPPA